MQTTTAGAYHLAAGEGQPMSWFTAAFQLKASDKQLGAMELTASPGVEPPMHMHRHEDEYYYVLEGAVSFHVGAENYRCGVGSFVFLPPHGAAGRIRTASAVFPSGPGNTGQ